ncbi:MAG: cupin domain-containing protein [Chloroflexota bacterium]|nr:cupin domain-containing protein [Chloroflexota bacterium]
MVTSDKFPKRTEKPWGFELLFAHTPKYAGKVIFVKKGHRLSLQYHEKKDESLYVHEGKALVEIEGKDGRMETVLFEAGGCWRVPPLTRHRLKAVEDTTLFEVSTPELDDLKRLEDDYGRVKP